MRKNKGFTLLEILIAMFIFTIVSIIMVTGLRSVLNSQAATEKQSDKLARLQIAVLIMSRDIEQAINRPITNAKGGMDPGLVGTPRSFTFTHAGFANPQGELQRSTLQRSQYSLDQENLIRETWQVLDQTAKTLPDSRVLLNNLSDIRFEYLDTEGKFTNNWPSSGVSKSPLPLAIRIQLTLKNMGKFSQIYLLPVSGEQDAKKT